MIYHQHVSEDIQTYLLVELHWVSVLGKEWRVSSLALASSRGAGLVCRGTNQRSDLPAFQRSIHLVHTNRPICCILWTEQLRVRLQIS